MYYLHCELFIFGNKSLIVLNVNFHSKLCKEGLILNFIAIL